MPNVVVSIPELGVTARGLERNKEIYVLAFTVDLRGRTAAAVSSPSGVHNSEVPALEGTEAQSAMEWVHVSVSNTFEHVRHDQPVSLSGSGVILYPNLDPCGLLQVHLVVVESDKKSRDVGALLSDVFDDPIVGAAVTALKVAATATQPLVGALMAAMISQVPKLLKKNKDDVLLTHTHSGFDFDDYGVPGTGGLPRVHDFDLRNNRAILKLRLRLG